MDLFLRTYMCATQTVGVFMKEQMELIKSKALEAIEIAETSAELNDVRVRFLGKSGEITNVMKGLGKKAFMESTGRCK